MIAISDAESFFNDLVKADNEGESDEWKLVNKIDPFSLFKLKML